MEAQNLNSYSTESKEKLYKKSGFVEQSVNAIVQLIVGVGVAVMVLIFIGALGGQTYNLVEPDINSIGNTPVIDSAWTSLNGTAVNIGNSFIHQGSLTIINSSNSANIALGNFTIDYTAGTAVLNTNAYNNSALLSNYSYGDITIQTHVKAAITSGFSALEQTGNYLPIIVLAVVIALVLMLILGFTAIGQTGTSGRGSAL